MLNLRHCTLQPKLQAKRNKEKKRKEKKRKKRKDCSGVLRHSLLPKLQQI